MKHAGFATSFVACMCLGSRLCPTFWIIRVMDASFGVDSEPVDASEQCPSSRGFSACEVPFGLLLERLRPGSGTIHAD